MSSSHPTTTKGKMKVDNGDNKWSSMKEVLNSFDNVSLMPSARGQDDDIFACPSPPKHRISPSQLELFEDLRHNPVTPMGRGRTMKHLEQKINPKARDMALLNDIKATKIGNFSNTVIEDYFNNLLEPDSDVQAKDRIMFEDPVVGGTEESSETSGDVCSSKSPVQISISSNLRPEAGDFYPSGMYPDSVGSSTSALLPDAYGFLPFGSVSSPVKRWSENDKIPCYKTSWKDNYFVENEISDGKKDDHIGFNFRHGFEIDATDNITIPEVSGINLTVDNSSYLNGSSSKKENEPVLSQQVHPAKTRDQKQPRPKMKNALLSSLLLKNQPVSLKTPMDFQCPSNAEDNATKACKSPQTPAQHLATPYDFLKDTTIDPETKDLIYSLTSTPSCSSSSLSTPSSTPTPSSPRSLSSKKFLGPKSLSSYDYNFNEKDFPPL